jgi:hypothetical protein
VDRNQNQLATGLLRPLVYRRDNKKKIRRRVMDNTEADDDSRLGRDRFCVQDIIWAVGIWSVILTLSPIVMVYVLMVN